MLKVLTKCCKILQQLKARFLAGFRRHGAVLRATLQSAEVLKIHACVRAHTRSLHFSGSALRLFWPTPPEETAAIKVLKSIFSTYSS